MTPPPDVTPEQLSAIREIALAGTSGKGYPKIKNLRGQSSTPWLYDELAREGLLFESSGFYFPTLNGLKCIQEPFSQRAMQQILSLFRGLKKLYIENPADTFNLDQIANSGGLTDQESWRLLPLLISFGIFSSWPRQTDQGYLGAVTLNDKILDLDPFAEKVPLDEDPSDEVILSARDFRGLASLRWEIDGVCLLAGSNGAGKTSILEALSFLRNVFQGGIEEAVKQARGAYGLRRVGAEPRSFVELGVSVGKVSWQLRLPVDGGSVRANAGEDVLIGEKSFLHRSPFAADWYLGKQSMPSDERSCLRAAYDQGRPPELADLVRVLRGFQVYGRYNLDEVRNGAPVIEEGRRLREDGRNLLSVLRTWHSAPMKHNQRFEWVLKQARRAFPEQIAQIEFETVGSLVQARFFRPGASNPADGLPFHVASDGLLAGLLHLTAVAGAEDDSLMAIEELENHLHPHAIRVMIEAIREVADERRVRVLLTTHSFSLMNEFRRDYEHFFVLESGNSKTPVRLDELRDPDYLAQFYPGELYDREDFGAPGGADADSTNR